MPGPLINIIIGILVSVVGYMLAPKMKTPKPPEVTDADDPTANEHVPIIELFGSCRIQGINMIAFLEKETVMIEASSSGKK